MSEEQNDPNGGTPLAEPIGSANRICERADRCDKLTSDGERCRHGYPHPLDSGCEMGCCAKLPFGAVCRPLPNKTGTDKPKKRHRLTGAELDAHPAMIELRRMLKDGELDAGRTRDYLNKEGNKA